MTIDCLTHLEDARFDDVDLVKMLARGKMAGAEVVIDAPSYPSSATGRARVDALCTAQATSELVRKLPLILRAWGIHPLAVHGDNLVHQLAALDDNLHQWPAVAIGECGLDRRAHAPDFVSQQRALAAQLAKARALDIPLILHAVHAWQPLLDILDDSGPARGIVHGFTGAPEIASQLRRRGFAISLGAAVLAPGRKLRDTILQMSLEDFVVETDAPEHPRSGESARASVGEAGDLARIFNALSTLRDEDASTLAAASTANARRIFGLPRG